MKDGAELPSSLLVRNGPLAGHRVEVEHELLVGRENADMTIADSEVSRRHAVVRPAPGGLEIEDLGSLNGTWVNGERIDASRPLRPGDLVKVGRTTIEVQAVAAPEPAPATRSPATGAPRERVSARPEREVREPQPAEVPAPASPAGAQPRPAPPTEGARDEGSPDELRPITALFADVVGSTRLGERLAPDEVKALVGGSVTRMTRAVEEFGGSVHAYMGDGIAAFFGAPAVHEDDPERAARAALRIIEVIGQHARDIEEAWGVTDFNVRVGINTGRTAIGLVGAADPQAVALGDIPNVAARLQSAAAPGKVVVGDATAKALADRFVLEPLGALEVKGRTAPVVAWQLVRARADLRVAPRAALIDREAELAQLRQTLEELVTGRGQIVFVTGDPGIGKTRLLAELRSLAGERASWLEGHSISYGGELLYWPFVEMLRRWLGVEDGDGEVVVRVKLRTKLTALFGPRLPEVLPYLGRFLSVRLEPEFEETVEKLAPEALPAEIRRAYKAWIGALTERQPVIVALEDVHWADALTCELAEDLLEVTDRAPLLLIATSRVDRSSDGWHFWLRALAAYGHRSTELRLRPLTEEASQELLAQLVPGLIDKSARREIVTRAEGNPLYLEELFNALIQGGGLKRERTWTLTFNAAELLPPALENLLIARIDRLRESARRVTQIAAVIGRTFPARVLELVSESEDLTGDIANLLRAEIIQERRRYPELEYSFKHGLLQQAALSTLPAARRAELYGRVATAFEEVFGPSLDDHLEILAHFYARSRKLGKALEYLERAGEKAAALQANAQAAELLNRALKVAAELDDGSAERRIRDRLAGLEAASSRAPQPG